MESSDKVECAVARTSISVQAGEDERSALLDSTEPAEDLNRDKSIENNVISEISKKRTTARVPNN
jgi:hypothetical protein